MFLFQAVTSAKPQQGAQATKEIIATYRNKDTGKEYHRHLLKDSDGKLFDPMMSKYGYMDEKEWIRRIGLGNRFEFSFGGKKEEAPVKKANEPERAKAKTSKPASAFFASGKEAFHEEIAAAPLTPMIKGRLGGGFSDFLPRAAEKKPGEKSTLELAYEYGKKYNVAPILILAMIFSESEGRAGVISKSNCVGLMQLAPSTAYSIKDPDGKRIIRGPADLLNRAKNVEAGAAYIAQQLSANPDDIATALYGYNGGPGKARTLESSGYAKGGRGSAKRYAGKVLSAYKLFSEMGVDALYGGMGLKDFMLSDNFRKAVEECKGKADGGYLAGFDFGKNFSYPQGNEIAVSNPFLKISQPK